MLTAGVLSGPMSVGLILITLALLDKKEPKPQAGDIFQGFSYFLQSFLYFLALIIVAMIGFLILNFIPCLGQILGMLYVYALQALTMFSLFLIADRKMEFIDAIKASVDIVKTNFWPFLGLSVVASIIASLGSILCGIGVVLTMPIYFCIIAVAYRNVVTPPAPAV